MFAAEPLDLVVLPGNHFNIIYPPFVDALADAMRARITP